MSLIKCPGCNSYISVLETSCPNCSICITDELIERLQYDEQKEEKKVKRDRKLSGMDSWMAYR